MMPGSPSRCITSSKALAPPDRRALHELFVYVNKHIAEIQFPSSPILEDICMVAMLLEMLKEVMNLERNEMNKSLASGFDQPLRSFPLVGWK